MVSLIHFPDWASDLLHGILFGAPIHKADFYISCTYQLFWLPNLQSLRSDLCDIQLVMSYRKQAT